MSKPSLTERTALVFGVQTDADTLRGGGVLNTTNLTTGLLRAGVAGPSLVADATIAPYRQEMEQMPLSGSYNPLTMEAEVEELEEALSNLDPSGVAVGRSTFGITGNFYVFGQGIVNLWPVWTKLWRLCGFQETRYASEANPGTSIATPGGCAPDAADIYGDMADGEYFYDFTVMLQEDGTTPAQTMATARFESQLKGGTRDSATVSGSGPGNNTGRTVTVTLADEDGIRRVYRTKVGAGTNGQMYLVGQLPHNVNTFKDRLHDNNLTDRAPTNGSDSYIEWAPRSSGFEAGTVMVYLDGRRYIAKGCRGNIQLAPDAGSFIRGTITLLGTTQPNEKLDNPNIVSLGTFPAKFCAADVAFKETATTAFVPVVTAMSFDTGWEITQRLDANAPCAQNGVKEYSIVSKPQPRWGFSIEFDEDQDFISHFSDQDRFAVRATLGDGIGKEMQFHNDATFAGGGTPAIYLAQIVEAPRWDDSNKHRTQPLVFKPLGSGSGDWIRIITDKDT